MSRQAIQRILNSLARRTQGGPGADAANGSTRRGVLQLETLESRAMLAGDVELLSTEMGPIQPDPIPTATALPQGDVPAEGEAENDLVQFAKNLDAAGVEFFGANWCPACTQQKQLFEDGGDDLPFIEVTNPDRTPNSIGIAEGITQYPTWRFPDDSEAVGVLDLATISSRSGVPIPQSETPTFAAVGAQDVRIGSPLHIPIDAYDPDGNVLTTTISVADPSLVEATVITGNRSLRLDMEGFGDMVFELFEQRAPRPAGRVADLADAGFYDGIIFHRVVNGFVIQAGDPTGTGTSGSTLGTFDDQFHPDLQHNRGGVLSFAKTTDDTNNSQFFVTEVDTRFLDFNHSIFGQLVEGEDVREAISNMETNPSGSQGGTPTTPIRIDNATVFNDTENSVIMLKALAGTGSTTVTVTVTDGDGNTHSEVIPVTVIADLDDQTNQPINSQPFLADITEPITSPVDQAAVIQLASTDIEGDPVTYSASIPSAQAGNATVSVTQAGVVTVTPTTGFTGSVDVNLTVQAQTSASGDDRQTIEVSFTAGSLTAPTGIDLSATDDSGSSSSDNITNSGSLTFTVTGVTDGNSVEIVNTATGSVVGVGTASGTTATITTTNIAALGDGDYVLAARQSDGTTSSGNSTSLTLTYDVTLPASATGNVSTTANVARAYATDLSSADEGSGLVYRIASGPNGASIDAASGLISWTPVEAQLGTNTFTIENEDVAGNIRTESFNVEVADTPLAGVRLEIVNSTGQVVSTIPNGEQFSLRMYGVDERNAFDRRGIFAAFADILFDPAFVRVVPGSVIAYEQGFATVQSGSFGTGIVDELGAAQSSTVPSNEQESLVATVQFEALSEGTTTIISEPADDTGSETLLYLEDDRVPAESVAFGNITLTITDDFSLVGDSFTVVEDSTTNSLDVLANDSVNQGSTLTLDSVTQPTTGGTVSISGGQVNFVPAPNFVGQANFTYTASSGSSQGTGNVVVTVTDVNDPPLAASDTFTVDVGSGLTTLDVLANDSFAPDTGETLSIASVSTTSAGSTVTISGNGQQINYTPAASFTGVDDFTYTVSDGTATAVTTVSVTVATVDDPPTAVDDAFAVVEDASEASFDVLANDSRDGENQAFTIVSVQAVSDGGTAAVSSDGLQLQYQPAANFSGVETVRYTIRDTGGGTASATATFTVTAVNDTPPAPDRTVARPLAGGEQVALAMSVLDAVNVDVGEVLNFTAVGTPSNGGTARFSSDGQSIFYTPPASATAGLQDTFIYTVTDADGLTATGTITMDLFDFELRDVVIDLDSLGDNAEFAFASLRLVGTNELGESVDLPATTNAGQVLFGDILPGNYSVEVPPIPFLQGGSEARQIAVTSAVNDGDQTISVDYGRLRPEFINVRDWLGSARRHSLTVAVAPDQDQIFMSPSSDTGDTSGHAVSLDSAGDTLTVSAVDDQSASVTTNVSTTPSRAVELRGQVGDLRLYKVSVDSRDVTFAAAATTASTGVGASVTQLSTGEVQAEGESPAVQAVTVADVFTPAPIAAASTASRFSRFASQDSITSATQQATSSAVAEDLETNSVDESMRDVTSSLRLRSSAADQVAESSTSDAPNASVVDRFLRSFR